MVSIQKQFMYRLAAVVLIAVSAVSISFFSFSANTSAQSAGEITNTVKTNCEKKAKKARSACGEIAQKAVNIASYNCKKAKKKSQCVTNKANMYIEKAAKGNPNAEKFKAAFAKYIKDKKVKGDPAKFSPTLGLTASNSKDANVFGGNAGDYQCGGDDTEPIATKFDFGCLGPENAPEDMSPIVDMAFAIIRFLSVGVGLIVVASIVYAGIQYSTSEGSAEKTQEAKARVRNAVIGLVFYIFSFALVQFLVPGGLFT